MAQQGAPEDRVFYCFCFFLFLFLPDSKQKQIAIKSVN